MKQTLEVHGLEDFVNAVIDAHDVGIDAVPGTYRRLGNLHIVELVNAAEAPEEDEAELEEEVDTNALVDEEDSLEDDSELSPEGSDELGETYEGEEVYEDELNGLNGDSEDDEIRSNTNL